MGKLSIRLLCYLFPNTQPMASDQDTDFSQGGENPLTWHPPRDEGLRHDALVEESLLKKSPRDGSIHDPGVYAVRLSTPATQSVETHSRLWLEHNDTTPEYLHDVAATEKTIYVGAAADVCERLHEHVNGEQTATLMESYPIHSLWEVWWYDRPADAFTHEQKHALNLQQTHPDAYVHSR